jgi:plastocyanin
VIAGPRNVGGTRAGARGALTFALCASMLACSQSHESAAPPAATEAPAEAPSGPTGRIRGVVTLVGTAPAPRAEAVFQNHDVCGQTVAVTRLAVGRGNGIRHAFVYLDGVKVQGKPVPRASTQVEQKGCEYGPHATTIMPGTDLEIVNDDPILHNVHARTSTPDGPLTVFNIAQPVRGQRTKIDAPLDKPGVVSLTCEAGHPWMTAHILVAAHPYVATTNDAGEFVIDRVPAGTYPIRMWHEGVRLKQIIPSLQRYEWEEPYESMQQITVTPDGETVVNFAMELRKPT